MLIDHLQVGNAGLILCICKFCQLGDRLLQSGLDPAQPRSASLLGSFGNHFKEISAIRILWRGCALEGLRVPQELRNNVKISNRFEKPANWAEGGVSAD